jgi:transcriptional regulator with XRE-family HTH domain
MARKVGQSSKDKIAKRLRCELEQRSWSQAELLRRAVGIAQQHELPPLDKAVLSKILKGGLYPSVRARLVIAKTLALEVDDLFAYPDLRTPSNLPEISGNGWTITKFADDSYRVVVNRRVTQIIANSLVKILSDDDKS